MIQEAHAQRRPAPRRRVRSAGYLLGAGLAALLEAVAFPGLLAWPAQPYALAAWCLAVAAVAMLWRARVRFSEPGAGGVLLGSALVGAGGVELLEALTRGRNGIDAWDVGRLATCALLVLVGARALRAATRRREGGKPRRAKRGRAA